MFEYPKILEIIGCRFGEKSFLSLLWRENANFTTNLTDTEQNTDVGRQFGRVTTSHKQSDQLRWCPGSQPRIFIQFVQGVATG
jgi:hypothetical protein